MFGFFGLDPIHWIIIAIVGLIVIGMPITIIILLVMLRKQKSGGEKE
jgi:hypothetical protein